MDTTVITQDEVLNQLTWYQIPASTDQQYDQVTVSPAGLGCRG